MYKHQRNPGMFSPHSQNSRSPNDHPETPGDHRIKQEFYDLGYERGYFDGRRIDQETYARGYQQGYYDGQKNSPADQESSSRARHELPQAAEPTRRTCAGPGAPDESKTFINQARFR